MSSKKKKKSVYCGKRPSRSLRIYDLRVSCWGFSLSLEAQCGQSVEHSMPLTSGNLIHFRNETSTCIKYSLSKQSPVWCQEWESIVVTLRGQGTSAWEGDLLLRAFLTRLAGSMFVSSQVQSLQLPREVGGALPRQSSRQGCGLHVHNTR